MDGGGREGWVMGDGSWVDWVAASNLQAGQAGCSLKTWVPRAHRVFSQGARDADGGPPRATKGHETCGGSCQCWLFIWSRHVVTGGTTI